MFKVKQEKNHYFFLTRKAGECYRAVMCSCVVEQSRVERGIKNGEEKMPDQALHNQAKVALCSLGGKKCCREVG